MRYCLALDLVDDEALIAEYEKAHEVIWLQVRDHLHRQGVENMEIYRLGTRLFMIMDVNDAVYDPQTMAQATATDPIIAQWEAAMWRYQVPTPWTPSGEKWVVMKQIFDLSRQ
ncbi:MAG: L-rhamnose mutarotase [Burkholderiaceae bacterium]